LIDKIRFFHEITREKKKKFEEMRGIEPQSAGCEFRVLTITPSRLLMLEWVKLVMYIKITPFSL
jgi:hypothetical protein